jgi:hypothetical protein
MKCTVEMDSYGMIYIPSSMNIDSSVEGIIKFSIRNLKGCNIGITDLRILWYMTLRWLYTA